MIPFDYYPAKSLRDAAPLVDHDTTQILAGGTTMLDLMKLNVVTPQKLVFIKNVVPSTIKRSGQILSIGAGVTMAQLADAEQGGKAYPVIRQSLILAATPQIRNMATIAGNLLQRPRSTYFRHPDMPVNGHPVTGFGRDVDTSMLAVLGHNGQLAGMYPGDFGVTAVAFDAKLELSNGENTRTVSARDFYQLPEKSFIYSTKLAPGEVITALHFPMTQALRNSFYLKVRERSSYAFALASVALGLEIDGGIIKDARVGLGGLGAIPWHSPEAEQVLIGAKAEEATFKKAADAALAGAEPPAGLEYKVTLAKRALERALTTLTESGPLNDEQLWAEQHGRPLATPKTGARA